MKSLATAMNAYLRELPNPNTREAYANDLGRYVAHLESLGVKSPDAVTTEMVANFLSSPLVKDLSDASRARKFSTIRSFHRWLHANGCGSGDPTADLERPRVQKRTTPKVADARQLQALAAKESLTYTERLVMVLALLGLTSSEIAGLNTNSVDTEKRVLILPDRAIPLTSDTLAFLEAYTRHERPRLYPPSWETALVLNKLGRRTSRQSIWKILQANTKLAGLGTLSTQDLKRSLAVHLLREGNTLQQVADLMGHKHLSTTHRYVQMARSV